MARILVVENDADTRSLIERRLGVADHEVFTVDSAEAALILTDDLGLPDVAVLDVGLPGMNGLDLAVALRTSDGAGALRIVFLSANVLPEQVAAGRALGARYVRKPYEASALRGAIDEALYQR